MNKQRIYQRGNPKLKRQRWEKELLPLVRETKGVDVAHEFRMGFLSGGQVSTHLASSEKRGWVSPYSKQNKRRKLMRGNPSLYRSKKY